ncbi:AbiV family abortive infection protein [Flavobacterium sp. NRK F10]|uniref:AbiV family abortive infection protein n=1 Tax=Flavobacterium sp. NRK F10 TaxID=2954931 RepID=UPI002091118C|nr:AbiV family abortive infection protein [Flavobacterium sp. NRK F10]MCO6173648.1 AbiV family abortive infection protein [Flavobacterium sp. NRK F10]
MNKNSKKNISEKKFKDLDAHATKGLSKIIFKNADRLKKDAKFLAEEKKSFSTATSLLILSLEEIIKAIIVELHALEYPIYKSKVVHKVFNDHKTRHEFASLLETLNATNILGALLQATFNKNKNNIVRLIPKNDYEKIMTGIGILCELLDNIYNDETIKLFNNYKNNGLYVDYRDELLVPDQMIKECHYEEVKGVHKTMSKIYRLIVLAHHPNIKNRNNYKAYRQIRVITYKLTKEGKINEWLDLSKED